MDYEEDEFDDEIQTLNKTLWVGNLHPNVSLKHLAELFYQVGPIEYVQFALDERGKFEDHAWVIFKHPISVEDGIQLLNGTKLYGMPVVTKKYSWKKQHYIDFDGKLNHFEQLLSVELDERSDDRDERTRRIDLSPVRRNYIADGSLRSSPAHDSYSNRDRRDRGSNSVSSGSSSIHQYGNSSSGNRNSGRSPNDTSRHSRGHYRKSERDVTSGLMDELSYDDDQYSYPDQDRKDQGYNARTSSSSDRSERSYRNQESSMVNKNNTSKFLPADRDLRDILNEKRRKSSQSDLKDIISNKFREQDIIEVHDPDSSNRHGDVIGDDIQWSEIINTDDIDEKYDIQNYNIQNYNIQNESHYIALEHSDTYSDNFNEQGKYSLNSFIDYSDVQYSNIESNRLQKSFGSSYRFKRDRKKKRNLDVKRRGHDFS